MRLKKSAKSSKRKNDKAIASDSSWIARRQWCQFKLYRHSDLLSSSGPDTQDADCAVNTCIDRWFVARTWVRFCNRQYRHSWRKITQSWVCSRIKQSQCGFVESEEWLSYYWQQGYEGDKIFNHESENLGRSSAAPFGPRLSWDDWGWWSVNWKEIVYESVRTSKRLSWLNLGILLRDS